MIRLRLWVVFMLCFLLRWGRLVGVVVSDALGQIHLGQIQDPLL